MSTRDPLADVLVQQIVAAQVPNVGTATGFLRRESADHLADVVRAFLASDETVERAARALYLEAENASMGFDAWPAWEDEDVSRDIFRSDARAALAAATEVRP